MSVQNQGSRTNTQELRSPTRSGRCPHDCRPFHSDPQSTDAQARARATIRFAEHDDGFPSACAGRVNFPLIDPCSMQGLNNTWFHFDPLSGRKRFFALRAGEKSEAKNHFGMEN